MLMVEVAAKAMAAPAVRETVYLLLLIDSELVAKK